MFNKKIVLSALIIGFVAIGVAGATWASFQDTVTSTNNGVMLAAPHVQYRNVADATSAWHDFDAATPHSYSVAATIPSNVLPILSTATIQQPVIQYLGIKNSNTVPSGINEKLNLKITDTATPASGVIPGLIIYVGDIVVYNGNPTSASGYGGFNPAYTGATGGDLTTALTPGNSQNLDITYVYPDSGNQNGDEGKAVSFDALVSAVASK